VHLVVETTSWDPFPPVRHAEDAEHRRAANRAVAVSAIGLALTGLSPLRCKHSSQPTVPVWICWHSLSSETLAPAW
jgi:hypothetical protein